MGNNINGDNSNNKKDPFRIDSHAEENVKKDLRRYKTLKNTASLKLDIEVNLHSPGNITNPGAGRSSTISRPVEQAVEHHQKRIAEIEAAQQKVDAIDRGIQECSYYASTAIRRDVRNGVRQILINQCYSVSTSSTCAPKTLRKYCRIAMFFIAYYLGYIDDDDLEGRVFPNKILDEVPEGKELWPWEMNEDSVAAKTMSRRKQYDEERKQKKAQRIRKNKEKKEKNRLIKEQERNGPPPGTETSTKETAGIENETIRKDSNEENED